MVCLQVMIYVIYIIIQTLLSVAVFGSLALGTYQTLPIHIIGPVVFTGILYLLCSYKHYTIANILLGLTIILGVLGDVYGFTHKDIIKHILQAEE